MNLPNLITLFRILLIPFFLNCLVYQYNRLALGILFLAFLSDGLDGLIARLTNQKTPLGTYLDPIADKLLLTASYITLSIIKLIPVWVSVILVSRDMVLVLGTILGTIMMDKVKMEVNITPSFAGKSSTLLQFLYLLLILFFVALNQSLTHLFPLLLLTVVISVASGFHYVYRGFIRS